MCSLVWPATRFGDRLQCVTHPPHVFGSAAPSPKYDAEKTRRNRPKRVPTRTRTPEATRQQRIEPAARTAVTAHNQNGNSCTLSPRRTTADPHQLTHRMARPTVSFNDDAHSDAPAIRWCCRWMPLSFESQNVSAHNNNDRRTHKKQARPRRGAGTAMNTTTTHNITTPPCSQLEPMTCDTPCSPSMFTLSNTGGARLLGTKQRDILTEATHPSRGADFPTHRPERVGTTLVLHSKSDRFLHTRKNMVFMEFVAFRGHYIRSEHDTMTQTPLFQVGLAVQVGGGDETLVSASCTQQQQVCREGFTRIDHQQISAEHILPQHVRPMSGLMVVSLCRSSVLLPVIISAVEILQQVLNYRPQQQTDVTRSVEQAT